MSKQQRVVISVMVPAMLTVLAPGDTLAEAELRVAGSLERDGWESEFWKQTPVKTEMQWDEADKPHVVELGSVCGDDDAGAEDDAPEQEHGPSLVEILEDLDRGHAGCVTGDLDALTHDAAGSMASNANNEGIGGQVDFLVTVAGWDDDEIRKALAEKGDIYPGEWLKH